MKIKTLIKKVADEKVEVVTLVMERKEKDYTEIKLKKLTKAVYPCEFEKKYKKYLNKKFVSFASSRDEREPVIQILID